jgi:hypothetical protein
MGEEQKLFKVLLIRRAFYIWKEQKLLKVFVLRQHRQCLPVPATTDTVVGNGTLSWKYWTHSIESKLHLSVHTSENKETFILSKFSGCKMIFVITVAMVDRKPHQNQN